MKVVHQINKLIVPTKIHLFSNLNNIKLEILKGSDILFIQDINVIITLVNIRSYGKFINL